MVIISYYAMWPRFSSFCYRRVNTEPEGFIDYYTYLYFSLENVTQMLDFYIKLLRPDMWLG